MIFPALFARGMFFLLFAAFPAAAYLTYKVNFSLAPARASKAPEMLLLQKNHIASGSVLKDDFLTAIFVVKSLCFKCIPKKFLALLPAILDGLGRNMFLTLKIKFTIPAANKKRGN